MSERASQYLTRKCEALLEAISFFNRATGSHGPGLNEKRLTFLAQIDFWNWEMDELIYCVSSFGDRCKAWEASKTDLDRMLRTQGIIVRKNQLLDATAYRRWSYHVQNVVAPVDKLKEVIEVWNKLLTDCEKLMQEGLGEYGVEALENLDKFRKKRNSEKGD